MLNNLETSPTQLLGMREQWLADLPALVVQITQTYGLSDLTPIAQPNYHYVLVGYQGTQAIVLKLGLDQAGLNKEAAALKVWQGYGVVALLAESDGMILLQRAVTGAALTSYFPSQDDKAICIVAACLARLHQTPLPATHPFPTINDWLIALDKDWDIPHHYLNSARTRRDALLATTAATVLLHGDLHHANILQHGTTWLVIDPKGVLGEPAYDVAAFIRNPIAALLASEDAAEVIQRRINRFATILALPRQRILDWCLVQAVLAWAWALEDGCDIACFKQLTEIFAGLYRSYFKM